MQFQQALTMAALVLAVAVVASVNCGESHPEPNTEICPGFHIGYSCQACCLKNNYHSFEIELPSFRCTCDVYFKRRNYKFNDKVYEDADVAEALQEPFNAVDKALKEKRIQLYKNRWPIDNLERQIKETEELLERKTKEIMQEDTETGAEKVQKLYWREMKKLPEDKAKLETRRKALEEDFKELEREEESVKALKQKAEDEWAKNH